MTSGQLRTLDAVVADRVDIISGAWFWQLRDTTVPDDLVRAGGTWTYVGQHVYFENVGDNEDTSAVDIVDLASDIDPVDDEWRRKNMVRVDEQGRRWSWVGGCWYWRAR